MATVHIEANKEDIAPRVLMPGDPNRAKYIAEKYLTDVKLVNQVRGELAFTGKYKDTPVTIFSSGMGIGSMGIYSYELFNDYDVYPDNGRVRFDYHFNIKICYCQ